MVVKADKHWLHKTENMASHSSLHHENNPHVRELQRCTPLRMKMIQASSCGEKNNDKVPSHALDHKLQQPTKNVSSDKYHFQNFQKQAEEALGYRHNSLSCPNRTHHKLTTWAVVFSKRPGIRSVKSCRKALASLTTVSDTDTVNS